MKYLNLMSIVMTAVIFSSCGPSKKLTAANTEIVNLRAKNDELSNKNIELSNKVGFTAKAIR